MLNTFQYWLHLLRYRLLADYQHILLLALVTSIIVCGIAASAFDFLSIDGAAPASLLRLSAMFVLGVITCALLLRRPRHISAKLQQTEAALKTRETWLQLALDAAHIGTWEWNMRDHTLRWSDRLDAIFGQAPDTCAHTVTAYLTLVYSSDQEAVAQAFGNALAGLQPQYSLVHRLVRPDGQLHWVEIQGRVLVDSAGCPSQSIGTIMDITIRKRLEAQLFQAQKMESIGLLTGSIAHDFNNLLTVISGYTQCARDTLPSNDLVRQDLDEILKIAGKATSLTRQLLTFAQKQIIESHVLNLNDLILNLEWLLRRLSGEDVELIIHIAPDLGLVKVDPSQIEQVLVNLAVNARQAMPRGGTLTIETQNVVLNKAETYQYLGLAPGAYASITMSDTGVGMDRKTQARIFEPFFTTKAPGEGSGLGLATCYGIITQHGGHISTYSELGQGTCFTIYLPQAIDSAPVRALGYEEGDLPCGNELVLVVEDNPAVRALTVRVLCQ